MAGEPDIRMTALRGNRVSERSVYIFWLFAGPRPRERMGPHPHALPALASLAPVIRSN